MNFANTTSTGEMQCVVQCAESSVVQLVRTVDEKQQFAKVITNFDYSREKLVNSSRDRNSVTIATVLFGIYFLLVS